MVSINKATTTDPSRLKFKSGINAVAKVVILGKALPKP